MNSVLAWFDIRTLLACQLLLILLLAGSMLVLRWASPGVRAGVIAVGYLLVIPGQILLIARGRISLVLSAVLGNALILLGQLLAYRGLQRFFHDRSRDFYLVEIAGVLATLTLLYYSTVHIGIIPRYLAVGLYFTLANGFIALTFWRNQEGRRLLLAGTAIYVFSTVVNLARCVAIAAGGATQDFDRPGATQTLALAAGFVYIGVTGLFLLAMIASELHETTLRDAHMDPLTGALTRRAVEKVFAQELSRAQRTGQMLSVLLIDIDHFKQFNDTAGHAAGDEALRTVSRTIRNELRTYDIFGRFGGDEMIVLLPAISGQQAMQAAERIRQSVLQLPALHNGLRATVSIGITQSQPHDSSRTLLARADAALYQVKRSGRNAVSLHQSAEPTVPRQEPTSQNSTLPG